jgi:K+-sensing histidine kinase KdpD
VNEREEAQRLRRELAAVKAQLERSEQRRASLLATTVHDLRTPLAIIQGYSQLLSADLSPQTDEATREYVTTIIAHAEWLDHMLKTLVDLDQAERGELGFAPERRDLNDLAGRAIPAVEGLAVLKGLRVDFHAVPAPVWVMVDAALIEQTLYNLLCHAVKYAQPESILRIEVAVEDRHGRVSVLDARRQLPPETVARLFDLAEVDLNKPFALRNMDLGLVLARHITERHGGRLEAVAEGDRGLALSLYLPTELMKNHD